MFPPLPGNTPSSTSGSDCPAGACVTLPYSYSDGGLLHPLLTQLGICLQFGMGQHGWGLAAPEGKVSTTDKVQRIPQRLYPDPPVKGGVVSLMRDGTTSSGWCIPPGYLGMYHAFSIDRRKFPPRSPLPGGDSMQ